MRDLIGVIFQPEDVRRAPEDAIVERVDLAAHAVRIGRHRAEKGVVRASYAADRAWGDERMAPGIGRVGSEDLPGGGDAFDKSAKRIRKVDQAIMVRTRRIGIDEAVGLAGAVVGGASEHGAIARDIDDPRVARPRIRIDEGGAPAARDETVGMVLSVQIAAIDDPLVVDARDRDGAGRPGSPGVTIVEKLPPLSRTKACVPLLST